MQTLEKIAALHLRGMSRGDIAFEMKLSDRMVAWLMDSDSFKVVLEKVGG